MSKFKDGHLSQAGFAHLPGIGDTVPEVSQLKGSIESGNASIHASPKSIKRAIRLEEGDLITGVVDITHEYAHMIPAIRAHKVDSDEKKLLEQHFRSLNIIPQKYRKDWRLDHPSNTVCFSLHFHRHHDGYATVLIAPSVEDSKRISRGIWADNLRREEIVRAGGADPGRNNKTDWFEGINGEYELVILRPDHFLIGMNAAMLVKHPITQDLKCFYASGSKDGHLREGSPTGPPLPPFRSRGMTDPEIPLNPILVNYAAIIRFRRLIRQDPSWGSTLSPRSINVLRNVVELHAAVIWTPSVLGDTQFEIEIAGIHPPLIRNLRGWPYPKPDSSTPALQAAEEDKHQGGSESPVLLRNVEPVSSGPDVKAAGSNKRKRESSGSESR